MCSHGVGRLHIVSGTVKAMDYIEILQNKLLPTARDLLGNQSWIFQDDNAPCHRAKFGNTLLFTVDLTMSTEVNCVFLIKHILSGKILGGPAAVFWRQKFFKKRQIEGFQKGVNDEKLLGSACVSGEKGDEMGVSQR
ncbi:hypothetical protein TNCV_3345231 [Trichonephila clavipes]|nr:hypothetical protein TNCV_3345231 [Trichonephila clavipes]